MSNVVAFGRQRCVPSASWSRHSCASEACRTGGTASAPLQSVSAGIRQHADRGDSTTRTGWVEMKGDGRWRWRRTLMSTLFRIAGCMVGEDDGESDKKGDSEASPGLSGVAGLRRGREERGRGRERGERIEQAANSHCLLSPRQNAAARSLNPSLNAAPPAHRRPAAVATGSSPSLSQWSETEIAALEWLFAGLLGLHGSIGRLQAHDGVVSATTHTSRWHCYT